MPRHEVIIGQTEQRTNRDVANFTWTILVDPLLREAICNELLKHTKEFPTWWSTCHVLHHVGILLLLENEIGVKCYIDKLSWTTTNTWFCKEKIRFFMALKRLWIPWYTIIFWCLVTCDIWLGTSSFSLVVCLTVRMHGVTWLNKGCEEQHSGYVT